MAFIRPAGFSDDDSDSDDDYGYYEKPSQKPIFNHFENNKRQTEDKLKEAIINDDIDNLKVIISKDFNNNVNAKLDSGWTPLLHACFQGQENVVQYLLENGADPNLNSDSVTPIMMACSNTNAKESAIYNIAVKLIDKNCILNMGDKYGLTPLMRASSGGHLTVVELMLEKTINIEMRDTQGWTALYWAILNNQTECVKILLSKGASTQLIDVHGRSPINIAELHGATDIINIIHKHLKIDDSGDQDELSDDICNNYNEWENYYPGLKKPDPDYTNEIFHLLEGMNCKRVQKLFCNGAVDLRTFLLLEEKDLIKLGMEMPYERQRIKHGLRCFHNRSWSLKSVAGLYAGKRDNYTILECLNVLGSHLQQLYILDATVAYVLRDYSRMGDPHESDDKKRLYEAVKKINANMNNIRGEINNMKKILRKINKESLRPADLIQDKSTFEVAQTYITKLVIICGIGYIARGFYVNLLKQ